MMTDEAFWQELRNKYETPYRYGKPVLSGSGNPGAFDEKGVDIPFVFFHNEKYYMMYTGYDGMGYQSALATSDDLVHWEHLAIILGKEQDLERFDSVSTAATWIIKESDDFDQVPRLKKIEGRYWLVYHAYPMKGYEAGPAEIGMAYCEDDSLLNWHRLDAPVLSYKDGAPWEQGGLYKACIIEKNGTWWMFYNAKDTQARWVEQTGAAISTDLLHWKRVEQNPLLKVTKGGFDGRFVSDPYLLWDGERWLNFYFGYDQGHAQEGLAVSEDLLTWEKMDTPLLSHGNVGDLDQNHAHKASIFYKDGILYHFYCATRPVRDGDKTEVFGEFRTIAVAASKPWDEAGLNK